LIDPGLRVLAGLQPGIAYRLDALGQAVKISASKLFE
jgi:hypothetical protein